MPLSDQFDIRQQLRAAYANAAAFSEDRKTQNGAVLWSTCGKCANGANVFPYELSEYPDDTVKNELIIHAEERAIFTAAALGVPTRGAVLFCPWAACGRCARAILGTGISELVTHKSMMDRTYAKYRVDVAKALAQLQHAGVRWTNWDGNIGEDTTNLMNNELWYP